MNTGRGVGLVLFAVAAVCLSGCTAGSVAELGVFGSYLDSDDLGDGYGAGAKLEIKPIDILSVDGRASWIFFDDFDIHMIPLEVAGRVNIPLLGERIVPYAGIGVGWYFFEADDIDLDDDFGYFPLVGLEVGTRSVALFAEARWLFLEADADVGSALEDLIDFDEADIDGLGINVGLLFRF
jgi:hypothetical protein